MRLRARYRFPIILAVALAPQLPAAGAAVEPAWADSTFGGAAPTDNVQAVMLVPAPPAARKEVKAALARVLALLPTPPRRYRREGGRPDTVSVQAGKLDQAGRWAPVAASAERLYEDRDDDSRTFEVRVALNGMRGLSPGLASVGGPVLSLELDGTPAFEQSMIGAEESRVALPLTEEERAAAITILRLYAVSPDLEPRVRARAEGGAAFPSLDISELSAPRPGAIRSVIVELYGPKRDVEWLARKISLAKLMRLLTPSP